MKRNWLLYLVIFSLALNFGTIGAFVYLRYQDRGQRLYHGIPPPLPMRALWGALKLEDSQRQVLHGLLPEHRGKSAEIRNALFLKRQELFDLLKGEAPAMPEVRVKIGEISALQGELEEEQMRFLLEIRKELKPEQKVAFLESDSGPPEPGPGRIMRSPGLAGPQDGPQEGTRCGPWYTSWPQGAGRS